MKSVGKSKIWHAYTYSITLLLLLLILIASTQINKNTTPLTFVIPKGWEAPKYDFSKNPPTEEGFSLGKQLFFDPILSRDSSISCVSCHLQFTAFTHTDHSLSHGINGLKGTRNSQTLFNLAWNTSFMWDGGVNNLEVQPINPITNPVEMDNHLDTVVNRLKQIPAYSKQFANAFGDSTITTPKILKALAQFIVMLQSYNSKYDKYIRQEEGANEMNINELKGLQLFRLNCASCHPEPLFTNNQLMNNGLPLDFELNDHGRMNITQDSTDDRKFKVPSLRNIAVSGPYMHDGRFKKLEQVIDHYTTGIEYSHTLAPQLQKAPTFSPEEKQNIIAFLKSLTDPFFLYNIQYRYQPNAMQNKQQTEVK